MTEKNASQLFRDDAAWYYARYRAAYPEQLFISLREYFQLDGKGILLDLGCGTGEVAVPLAASFEKIIGVDPSPQMLEEAKRRIAASGVNNITLIEGIAEEIELPNSVRLTTIATAFHWMRQSEVLAKLYPITEQNGGVAVIWGSSGGWWKTPEVWQQKVKELVIKYLGNERRAGQGIYTNYQQGFETFEDVIKHSPFKTFEVQSFPHTVERNIEEVLGLLYSRSWGSKRYFGDRLEEFEKEVKEALHNIDPSEHFAEQEEIVAYLLKKE